MTFVDVVFPEDQQEGTESAIASWQKQEGESVQKDEPLLEIATDKVVVEIPAPATGILRHVSRHEGDRIKPGEVLAQIEPGDIDAPTIASADGSPRDQRSQPVQASPAGATIDSQPLSPAVRRLLKEHDLDAANIRGSGRGGRITVEDVEHALATNSPTSSATHNESSLGGRSIPHSPMRKRIAQHMVQSALETSPHVTAVFDCDFSNVFAHKAKKAAEGVRITSTAFVVCGIARAVAAVPEVNARYFDDRLEVFEAVNVGVAAAIEGGLLVPVIRNVQEKTLEGVASELDESTAAARSGTLTAETMRDGTISLTNYGVGGSLFGTPIINQPQVAIVGMGKLEKRPVVVDDDVVVRPRAYLTLTFDHRALDGLQVNAFLSALVEAIEAPLP